MKAFIFPGQGSQFSGMGYNLYKSSNKAQKMFQLGNEILGFDICKIMFEGSEIELKQTNVTQPAIFLHSVILSECLSSFNPDMVAGHSLGEFSALVATKTLKFEEGLKLVIQRAEAMHLACQNQQSTMAAIIGLKADIIEEICMEANGIVTIANYNTPNQIVISGEEKAIKATTEKLASIGAKRTVMLTVGGAFHSPIMDSAKETLRENINNISFKNPICPIYQNVSANPISDPDTIKRNLIQQLTSPVKWYQTIEKMIQNGAKTFIEVGPGNVLIGLNRRINRDVNSETARL